MRVLALDTATADTVVGLVEIDDSLPGLDAGAKTVERHHRPGPDERPGHVTWSLALIHEVMTEAGVCWSDIDRIAVGTGPGSFTGLRIGIATARALAQANSIEVVGVSTLESLGAGLDEAAGTAARIAVIDARRGESFAAGWDSHGTAVLAPAARSPGVLADALRGLGTTVLAAGDGALRFRMQLEEAGATVPPDDHEIHHVHGAQTARLGATSPATGSKLPEPDYMREPDARRRTNTS